MSDFEEALAMPKSQYVRNLRAKPTARWRVCEQMSRSDFEEIVIARYCGEEVSYFMTASMAEAIYNFPDLLLEAIHLSQKISFPEIVAEKVVIFGMGGSAIGGDLAAVLSEKVLPAPLQVIRHEEIPHYLDKKTLAIVVSYSGNTEETLSALHASLSKSQGNIIGISTGGLLKEKASANHFPWIEIPGGLMPRAALPLTLVPILFILHHLAKFPDPSHDLQESITLLKQMRDELARADNEARRLAKKLHEKLPIVYACNPTFAPAAKRWKCQINENAKQPAYHEIFPEAAHNEIVGFTEKLPIHQNLFALLLRDSSESPGIQKRIEFAKELFSKAGIQVHQIHSQGKSLLARLLSLGYFGDYVSLYLAEENGVDPSPIVVIDQLKNAVSHRS